MTRSFDRRLSSGESLGEMVRPRPYYEREVKLEARDNVVQRPNNFLANPSRPILGQNASVNFGGSVKLTEQQGQASTGVTRAVMAKYPVLLLPPIP